MRCPPGRHSIPAGGRTPRKPAQHGEEPRKRKDWSLPPSCCSAVSFLSCVLRSVSSVFISGCVSGCTRPISGIVTDQEIQAAGTDFRPTLRSKVKGFPHENHF